MKNLMKKSTTLFVCVLLACSMFVLIGCGEEEAQYSAFWAKDQLKYPFSEHSHEELQEELTSSIDNDSSIESKFNTVTFQMLPGTKEKAKIKIWNRYEESDNTTTFRLSSDASWITFPEENISISSTPSLESKDTTKTEPYFEGSLGGMVVHVGPGVNIREDPTVRSRKVARTSEPMQFVLISKKYGNDDQKLWHQIGTHGLESGWVRSDLATLEPYEKERRGESEVEEKMDEDDGLSPVIIDVICNINLPEDIELPVTQYVYITPSKGNKTKLKVVIEEPDWWNVSWVSSGSKFLLVDLYQGTKKQLWIEIRNDSNVTKEFDVSSTNNNTIIEDLQFVAVEPGKIKEVFVWIDVVNLEKDMKANELITITPISDNPKGTTENDETDNQENTDDGAENTIRSKQLELELNLIVPYLDVFWEETGTDTITVEHYPFQTIIRNVTVENQSGKVMNIPIYGLGTDYIIRNNQINIAETKTIPVVIDKDADNHNIIYSLNRMDRYGDSYFDKSNSKSLELKVRNKVKERAFTKHSQKWTTGEHVIFTLHTDSKILAVVQNLSNKTVERKLHCYDNSTGEFLWEFPKKDNQEYDLITKSLHLEDVSSEYNKVIIEFNNSEIEYRPDKKCIILNSESGIESWSLVGFDFLSVFGDTDKCLVSELDYPGLDCGLFESRDLNTGKIIWRECLGYNSFLRADNNNAYFMGEEYVGIKQSAFSKNNPPKRVEYNTPY